MRTYQLITCIFVVLVFASCGKGSGSLSTSVGVVTSGYLILDLSSGQVTSQEAIGDLATNPVWRRSKMVFKRVDTTSGQVGSPASNFGHQTDETQTSASVGKYYLSVFEVTKGQWSTMVGTEPWTAIDSTSGMPANARAPLASLGGSVDEQDHPACNLTYNTVAAALATLNAGRAAKLALPSENQWELACRAGSGGAFSWGNARDALTAGTYATVWETNGGVQNSTAVAKHSANALGLYDLHGNVWEWTSGGELRGGSWNDSLPQARSANRLRQLGTFVLDPDTHHALAGVRFVLTP